MFDITASIVLYKSKRIELKKAIDGFLKTSFAIKLYLIDNSPTNDLKDITDDVRVEYIFNGSNMGFGKAHNIALRKIIDESRYHIVLNPDVSFTPETLTYLFNFMNQNNTVGLVLPKVLDSSSQLQYACKRLPSPADLIVRRLGLNFLNQLFERRLNYYEMRDMNYHESFEAPSLSGCFMFLRVDALKKVGFFDERFFMYMEDVDLSRRIHESFRTLYNPTCAIFHGHARESYKLNKLLLIHIVSAIKYFNKWGWIFDNTRKSINKNIPIL